MVILEAYNNEKLVERKEISTYDYYDEEDPLVDDLEYHKTHKINRMIISIYFDDENTQLENKSEVFYDENGNYLSDNVLFEK